jgi:glucose-6-phosphate 1-dehydrogenase
VPGVESSVRASRPADHVIVLFGARGDLARRKLLPGLFHLWTAGLMPEQFRIVGTGRKAISTDDFRAIAREAVKDVARANGGDRAARQFERTLTYAPSQAGDAKELTAAVEHASEEVGGEPCRLHYLSVPPGAFAGIAETLGEAGLAERSRVILEKPFGEDLASARRLNRLIHGLFDESQIFRIDHFLGKEAVQNVLALRFANGMFEPVWNHNHVDHVQIDAPETLSVSGREGFYEETGAFRDMIVTHLYQVLGFLAMEPPTSLDPAPLVDEQAKVFRSMLPLKPEDVVFGQYEGYREEEGVAPDSTTETFAAVRCEIDNWRWAGVPFFMRTGKRMATRRQVVTIAFREPPRRMFDMETSAGDGHDGLVFDLADPGGISAQFWAKLPGPTMRLGRARMSFSFADSFGTDRALEAYERLIHDAMLGDRTLFTRADGIERTWEVSQPVLDADVPVLPYAPGSWGPDAVRDLIAPRLWRLPEGS